MTTPRKDRTPSQLGILADLRGRVLALAPVREHAWQVCALVRQGIWPHPAILEGLHQALVASKWTTRSEPLEEDPARAHAPEKMPPREPLAISSTGATMGNVCGCTHRRRRRHQHGQPTGSHPRWKQLWLWPPEIVRGA